ncbi:MAG: hypothetical protein PWR20_1047 [Bacteroidales bacterium]|jgi:erythromycin esterase-like protein|nr:hypothetical protein [Bacteroidales bacterium]MDN5328275.1 hypothetical protein [Bacteroidales bacterium]
MDEDRFEDKLDRLIRIFKKLRQQATAEQLSGIDPRMLAQIDILIEQFEKIRSDPGAIQMFKEMMEPFEKMLNTLIPQLSEMLGEPIEEPEPVRPVIEPLELEKEVPVGKLTRRLVEIDKLLAKGGLTQEEEDLLLDERIKIMKKLNPEEYGN